MRNFVDNKQMKPVLVFAEKRDANFKDVPTSVELGDKVTLPQFRSIVVRAGTDPKIVKTLSDALAVAAKDPEYVKYLADQYADPASFVAGRQGARFLDGELKAMKALAAQVGMTKAEAASRRRKPRRTDRRRRARVVHGAPNVSEGRRERHPRRI